MTKLSNGMIVTDLDAHDDNEYLTWSGYSIRHIEDYPGNTSCITWDAPNEITELDLPY